VRYNIVAGEEMKKMLKGVVDNPIPFNEDMSVGTYVSEPFGLEFIRERSEVHKVSEEEYTSKLQEFLDIVNTVNKNNELHLFFGEDPTCVANSSLLVTYFKNKVKDIYLHVLDEYTGQELKQLKM